MNHFFNKMKYWLINWLPVDCDIIHLLKQTFMLVNRRELIPPTPEQFTTDQSEWLIDDVLYRSDELNSPLSQFAFFKKGRLFYSFYKPPYHDCYLKSFRVLSRIVSYDPLIIQL